MKLPDLNALIIGASGKLGSAIAGALAQKKVRCACHYYHNADKAVALIKSIRRQRGTAVAIQADIRCQDQIERLFDQVRQSIGTPSILIDCASIFARQPILQLDRQHIEPMIAVNLTAPLLLAKEFAKGLMAPAKKKSGGDVAGKMIFLSDTACARPWANFAPYCATRAGLSAITVSLAKELAPKILVNTLALGIVETPTQPLSATEKQRQVRRIPLGRFAALDEVVGAVLFLLENDYITGQTLFLDGGRSL